MHACTVSSMVVSVHYFVQIHNYSADFSGNPEDLPTLQEFLCFPMPTSKVNLAEKIGTDYYKFGILLLEDDKGDRIDVMEKESRGRAKDINRQVFRLWLKGHGRKPVSWGTLVSVLHDIGQTNLASEITEVKKLLRCQQYNLK